MSGNAWLQINSSIPGTTCNNSTKLELEQSKTRLSSKPPICQSSGSVLTATDSSLEQSIFCATFALTQKRNHSSARCAERHILESKITMQSQLASLMRHRDTLVRHAKSHRPDCVVEENGVQGLAESQRREMPLSPQGSPEGTAQSTRSQSSHSDQAPARNEISHSLQGERRLRTSARQLYTLLILRKAKMGTCLVKKI